MRTRLLIGAVLVSVSLLCSGCLPVNRGPADDARRYETLNAYFVPTAIEGVEGKRGMGTIPMRYGPIPGTFGFASGDDWGSRLISILYGYGNERHVIVIENPSDRTVLHEYVHQADYSGFISTPLFRERFERMREDSEYSAVALEEETWIRETYGSQLISALALLYNDGLTRELIAFLIEDWAAGEIELPGYMLEVYEDTIILDAAKALRASASSEAPSRKGRVCGLLHQ